MPRFLLLLLALPAVQCKKDVQTNPVRFVPCCSQSIFGKSLEVAWQLTGQEISEGQPWGSPSVSTSGNTVTVRAGQHKTGQVASKFKDGLTWKNLMRSDMNVRSMPGKLNFYIEGTLSLYIGGGGVVTCENLLLGQGGTGASNLQRMWWFGGKHCSQDGYSDFLKCQCKTKRNSTRWVDFRNGDMPKEFNVWDISSARRLMFAPTSPSGVELENTTLVLV